MGKTIGCIDSWMNVSVGILPRLAGFRDAGYAYEFMSGLKSRLANRVQITADGRRVYLWPVEDAFGAKVNYARLVKLYGQQPRTYNKSQDHPLTNCFISVILESEPSFSVFS